MIIIHDGKSRRAKYLYINNNKIFRLSEEKARVCVCVWFKEPRAKKMRGDEGTSHRMKLLLFLYINYLPSR